ncbi:hypothetical protein NDU88_006136 [Pleurodeles waltl]|uniref:Uncharacterized protein n=1 Tax=Pleurodeles waltl TaxID=8319 RepID=A0AAV7SNQ6_PLEWA|nr:hypothetical protein NDU88_006136 [Pleurodeles waltl]
MVLDADKERPQTILKMLPGLRGMQTCAQLLGGGTPAEVPRAVTPQWRCTTQRAGGLTSITEVSRWDPDVRSWPGR